MPPPQIKKKDNRARSGKAVNIGRNNSKNSPRPGRTGPSTSKAVRVNNNTNKYNKASEL